MLDSGGGFAELRIGDLLALREKDVGATAIDAWLASSRLDGAALVERLEDERSLRSAWEPKDSLAHAIAWLHLVRDPRAIRLVPHASEVLSGLKDLDLPEGVEEHLERRARSILEGASRSRLHKPQALHVLLSDTKLTLTGDGVAFWEDVSVPVTAAFEAFATRRFGLVDLRKQIVTGVPEFDAVVSAGGMVHVESLLADLAEVIQGKGGLSVTAYMDCFGVLRADERAFAMLVDALARSAQMAGTDDRLPKEAELLRSLARMSAATGETVARLADLEVIALRNPDAFFEALIGAIVNVWNSGREASTYATMCLSRILRKLAAGTLDETNVVRVERMCAALLTLPEGQAVLWLLDRLAELDLGIGPENVAWAYVAEGVKEHWSWLVYERIKDDAGIVDAFIKFSMRWLSRGTYNDVESLVVELARDAGRWGTIEELANLSGGAAMLRASHLCRRRRLNRLSKAYGLGGDEGFSGT